MKAIRITAIGLLLTASAVPAYAQTLRGSKTTMVRQNRIAVDHDYTFLNNDAHVRKFVRLGLLVRVSGNSSVSLGSVSYPYARPELKLFIQRLGAQYRSACGEKLVVTSLTRPLSEQPRNASDLSVHPTGMAVDLRVSNRSKCRSWLERTLLSLERAGVVDAIRERRPPHYHVAVFPNQYADYVERITGRSARLASSRSASTRAAAPAAASEAEDSGTPEDEASGPAASSGDDVEVTTISYRVTRGETLWTIARRHGTTVNAIREANGMSGSRIDPGQVLVIPLP